MSEPLRATTIHVMTCTHGGVHVGFKGPNGELLATASMDAHTAGQFLDDFAEAVEDAIGLIQSKAAATAGLQH